MNRRALLLGAVAAAVAPPAAVSAANIAKLFEALPAAAPVAIWAQRRADGVAYALLRWTGESETLADPVCAWRSDVGGVSGFLDYGEPKPLGFLSLR